MLDPKLLRSDLPAWRPSLARRGFVLDTGAFAALEEQRKALQIEADRLRAERNASAKAVGQAKAQGRGRDAAPGARATRSAPSSQAVEKQLGRHPGANSTALQLGLPNLLHASVPDGADESRQRRSPALGRAARRSPSSPRIMWPSASPRHGFRGGGTHLGRALRGHDGVTRAAAPRAHPIHARHARRRTRLSRGLRAVSGARRSAAGHRAAAEIRTRPVPRCRATPDSF